VNDPRKVDPESLTPGEKAAGMTVETKERARLGELDTDAVEHNERAHARAAATILGSAARFKRRLKEFTGLA
jgi:hypothetical protein